MTVDGRDWNTEVVDAETVLAAFPSETEDKEDALHDGRDKVHDPTCDIVVSSE